MISSVSYSISSGAGCCCSLAVRQFLPPRDQTRFRVALRLLLAHNTEVHGVRHRLFQILSLEFVGERVAVVFALVRVRVRVCAQDQTLLKKTSSKR